MRYWHLRLFCVECDYNIWAAGNNSDIRHAMCGIGGCCPGCGTAVERKCLTPVSGKPFVLKIVRWISTSTWWKLELRRKGYWEEKNNANQC